MPAESLGTSAIVVAILLLLFVALFMFFVVLLVLLVFLGFFRRFFDHVAGALEGRGSGRRVVRDLNRRLAGFPLAFATDRFAFGGDASVFTSDVKVEQFVLVAQGELLAGGEEGVVAAGVDHQQIRVGEFVAR